MQLHILHTEPAVPDACVQLKCNIYFIIIPSGARTYSIYLTLTNAPLWSELFRLLIKWLHAAHFARNSWHPWNWLLLHRSHVWCNLTAFFICLCLQASLPLLMKYINLVFSCCVGSVCYDLLPLCNSSPLLSLLHHHHHHHQFWLKLEPLSQTPTTRFFIWSHVPLPERNLHLEARTT